MELVTLFFIFVAFHKTISIVQAIRWLWNRGDEYRKRLRHVDPSKPSDFLTLMESCTLTGFASFLRRMETDESEWKRFFTDKAAEI